MRSGKFAGSPHDCHAFRWTKALLSSGRGNALGTLFVKRPATPAVRESSLSTLGTGFAIAGDSSKIGGTSGQLSLDCLMFVQIE